MRSTTSRIILWFFLLLGVVAVALIVLRSPKPKESIASVLLPDGRILNIEGLTYGTDHRIGDQSLLVERFGPWLPKKVNELAASRYPRSEIQLQTPGLVVWVNALDPSTGKHVDCQGIRVEFIDEHGDLFGQETSSWFGGNAFWRCGHVFHAFPRTQRELTFQVTSWKSNETVQVKFPNPIVTTSARWIGRRLPQQQSVGDVDILLTGLTQGTNGGPKRYWESPARYWEPQWELRQRGQPAAGWDAPEWSAADPSGNEGKFLGVHQPVHRFSASFYPSATNLAATVLIANSPSIAATNFTATNWWNLSTRQGTSAIAVLGLFPAGTHVFSEGAYQTNPPVTMGPTIGGSPSGWVGQGRRVTPARMRYWNGHYTPSPVIYLRASPLPADQRIAVRLRDQQGRYWIAKPDPRGAHDIQPFLVELQTDVTTLTAEIVLLKPLKATFDVDTSHADARSIR